MLRITQIGLRAADKSCEAPPNLRQASYQQPCLFALDCLLATPFPRKSRHRSDEKCLPQSASQLQSQSLTRLTALCLFCRGELEQRVCQGRALRITGTNVRDSLSKIKCHTLSSEAKHRADLRRPQEVCNSSIQENGSSALKPLGVRYRTASGSDRPCAFLRDIHIYRPVATARGSEIKSFQAERAADRTLDTANPGRESRPYITTRSSN